VNFSAFDFPAQAKSTVHY